MTAPMPHVWTADEYDRLPESDNVRRELVDGVLWVAPGPRDLHQILVARLCVALHDSAPRDQYRVTQGVEVKLGELLRYIPDVLAVTVAAGRNRSQFYAHELVLAVEVESPSSLSLDRIIKPAHYANAGIPYYWRVELDDEVRLVVHENVGGTYRVVGTFIGKVELEVPWAVSFDLNELTA